MAVLALFIETIDGIAYFAIAVRLGRGRLAINEVLAALADDTRRKILLKLQEGKISSGDLAIALDMTPQALSYHLSKLKRQT